MESDLQDDAYARIVMVTLCLKIAIAVSGSGIDSTVSSKARSVTAACRIAEGRDIHLESNVMGAFCSK